MKVEVTIQTEQTFRVDTDELAKVFDTEWREHVADYDVVDDACKLDFVRDTVSEIGADIGDYPEALVNFPDGAESTTEISDIDVRQLRAS